MRVLIVSSYLLLCTTSRVDTEVCNEAGAGDARETRNGRGFCACAARPAPPVPAPAATLATLPASRPAADVHIPERDADGPQSSVYGHKLYESCR